MNDLAHKLKNEVLIEAFSTYAYEIIRRGLLPTNPMNDELERIIDNLRALDNARP